MRVALGTTALILLQSSHGFTTPLRSSNDKKSIFPAWANKKAPFQKAQEVDLGGDDDPDDLKSAVKAAVRKASLMEKISDKAIPVRFVNFDPKNPLRQLVAYVPEGKNLLKIGDEAGIHIPRQCRSGLCGSCTADVKDPNWFEEGSRQGYQTIRTCQAGAMVPSGCEEMVVDLYRMLNEQPEVVEAGGENAKQATLRVASPTMSNFQDDWEKDFAPDYKTGGKPAVISSSTPAYTLSGSTSTSSGGKKKLRRWVPHSASNIPPWEIIW